VAVSCSPRHTCALKEDGTVWCWGRNRNGQLGDGTLRARLAPVQVKGLTGATQVIAGRRMSCALRKDGTVRCWGLRRKVPYSDAAPFELLPVPALPAAKRLLGSHCAVSRDDRVWCWQWKGARQWREPGGQTQIRAARISAAAPLRAPADATSYQHWNRTQCAIREGGTVWCWGTSYFGAVGLGTTDRIESPTRLDEIQHAVGIAVGYDRACAWRKDGKVFCWGKGRHAGLGNGRNQDSHRPVRVKYLPDAFFVGLGEDHACALRRIGEVRCWGKSTLGAIGDGPGSTSKLRFVPRRVLLPPRQVVALGVGEKHNCAVLKDGSVWCWGDGSEGQLGNGRAAWTPRRVTGQGEP
jgi:alpha-tubulin suppressor-like RCC1 family protein